MHQIFAQHVGVWAVFLEGVLSFLSPCVLPLLPIYLGYLAGGTAVGENAPHYDRKRVMLHTICFVVGISMAFVVLGFSLSAVGALFSRWHSVLTRVGGLFIFLMGLFQLGVLRLNFLQREHRLGWRPNGAMGPGMAFLMGFVFSFSWTPCVGPALASVLALAAGSGSGTQGALLLLVYAAGFSIPFLILGAFTTQALNWLAKRRDIVKWTVRLGGVVLVGIGLWVLFSGASMAPATGQEQTEQTQQTETTEQEEESEFLAPDFTLTDQYGNTHTLSDYKGKAVIVNFWTTWCGYCKQEMPDLQELYEQYGENSGDVVVLGIANPSNEEYPHNADESQEVVEQFLQDNGYTFPVLMDTTGQVLATYGVQGFPVTLFVTRDSELYTYVPGMVDKETLHDLLQQTLDFEAP